MSEIKRLSEFPIPPFSGGDQSIRTYLMPCGIISGECEGTIPLAGGAQYFTHLDVFIDDGSMITVTRAAAADLLEHVQEADIAKAKIALGKLMEKRPDYAGLDMSRYHIMGIINTTPDSFSDGGDHLAAETATSAALEMVGQGAAILDVGGESTRPGAEAVGFDEEGRRILPVIERLKAEGHIVSADTRHTNVMKTALDHGADIINDVGGLRDEGAIALVSSRQVPVMIMHMQGEPGTMQKDPNYRFAPLDIYNWLEERIALCEAAGLPRHMIAIDPGFGFGKTPHHNMQIMAHLALYHGLGVPIVLGVSRKSTIAHFAHGEAAKDRMPGSVALATAGRLQGVQIFRVHDVAETEQALANIEALMARSL